VFRTQPISYSPHNPHPWSRLFLSRKKTPRSSRLRSCPRCRASRGYLVYVRFSTQKFDQVSDFKDLCLLRDVVINLIFFFICFIQRPPCVRPCLYPYPIRNLGFRPGHCSPIPPRNWVFLTVGSAAYNFGLWFTNSTCFLSNNVLVLCRVVFLGFFILRFMLASFPLHFTPYHLRILIILGFLQSDLGLATVGTVSGLGATILYALRRRFGPIITAIIFVGQFVASAFAVSTNNSFCYSRKLY
jgi:hypothetical protein